MNNYMPQIFEILFYIYILFCLYTYYYAWSIVANHEKVDCAKPPLFLPKLP